MIMQFHNKEFLHAALIPKLVCMQPEDLAGEFDSLVVGFLEKPPNTVNISCHTCTVAIATHTDRMSVQ